MPGVLFLFKPAPGRQRRLPPVYAHLYARYRATPEAVRKITTAPRKNSLRDTTEPKSNKEQRNALKLYPRRFLCSLFEPQKEKRHLIPSAFVGNDEQKGASF